MPTESATPADGWVAAAWAVGNAERDNRSPGAVLALVMSSEHGIHLLYQAIVDGREGQPPRRVDDQGNRVPDGTGVVPAIANAWLRDTFPVKRAWGP
jgi:hypothetical protein